LLTHNFDLSLAIFADLDGLNAFLSWLLINHTQERLVWADGSAIVT
jgi:hypothetical protein